VLAITLAIAVALSVQSAGAAPALGPPVGWPDLAGMAITPADLSAAAKVDQQGYVKPDADFFAEYDRVFRSFSVKLGTRRLIELENDVFLGRTVDKADTFMGLLPLGLIAALDDFRQGVTQDSGLKVTYVKLGKPSGLGIGNNSFGITFRFGTRAGEIRVVIGGVRVGQVDHVFVLAGIPRAHIGLADVKRLARNAVAHTKSALVPSSVAPPTITELPQIGQTLSAAAGTWLSFPRSYGYQWQRCDGSGGNCVAIAGATSPSYVPTTDDLAATLTVVVSAQNAYGTGTATAVATAAVTAQAPPGG
jgi:hypothetical protein